MSRHYGADSLSRIPYLQLFSHELRKELGLPHTLCSESDEEKAHWRYLKEAADQKVVSSFPQLADPPPHYQKPVISAPYRPYKLIAPVSKSDDATQEPSNVFIGHIGVGNYFPAVECQAMWATAYLDGELAVPARQAREREIALFTAWN
jgi:dimethylaniline monooxygenase (N-oxide forming)